MSDNGQKLSTRTVCERYSVSERTIGRWELDPTLAFPRATKILGRRYYDEAQVIAWERANAAMVAGRVGKKSVDEAPTHRVVHTRA